MIDCDCWRWKWGRGEILPALQSFAVKVEDSWLRRLLTSQVYCCSSSSPPSNIVRLLPGWTFPPEIHWNCNRSVWLSPAEHCSTADTLELLLLFMWHLMEGLATHSMWSQTHTWVKTHLVHMSVFNSGDKWMKLIHTKLKNNHMHWAYNVSWDSLNYKVSMLL